MEKDINLESLKNKEVSFDWVSGKGYYISLEEDNQIIRILLPENFQKALRKVIEDSHLGD